MCTFLPPAPVVRIARPACASRAAAGALVCSALSRRMFLRAIPAVAALGLCSPAARAERTGMYSTRLTAKRRYLPRIAAGFAALRAMRLKEKPRKVWRSEVRSFLKGPGEDLSYAMPLFSSTYFSEGPRITPKERELKEVQKLFFAAVQEMGKAKSFEQVTLAREKAMQQATNFIEAANIRDALEEAKFNGF